jgi:hypothetical protein
MALARHSSAVQSIHDFSCNVLLQTGLDSQRTWLTGRYLRSGNKVRIREDYPDGRVEESLVHDGEIITVSKNPNEQSPSNKVAAGRRSASERSPVCDVWSRMLLTFPGRNGAKLSLNERLKTPVKDLAAETQPVGAVQYYVIKYRYSNEPGPDISIAIWLDPNVNYLAKKMLLKWKVGQEENRSIFEANQFQEVLPGIFFPSECTSSTFYGSKQLDKWITRVSDVRINEGIQKERLALAVPSGASFVDTVTLKAYKVGPDGRPTGPIHSLVPGIISSVPKGVDSSDTNVKQTYIRPTENDGQSLATYLLPISVMVFVAATTIWLIRKRANSK